MTITSPNLSWTLTTSGGVMDSRGVSEAIDPNAKYVSLTGSDSNTGSSISPWRNPDVAASRLTDGQTLYFRAGTYDIATPTANRSCAIKPGGNNCTLSAYPGESVTLRGGIGGSNYGVFPTGGTIGTGIKSGVLVKGFTIRGMFMFDGTPAGSRPSRLEDCDVSVGGDGWPGTNQGGVIWIDDAANIEVVNCVIHDNGYGSQSTNPGNDGLVMAYDVHGCLFERCTLKNSTGVGFTFKDDAEHVTIKQCWVDNIPYSGFWTGNNEAIAYDWSVELTQNLFTRVCTTNNEDWGVVKMVTYSSLCYVHNNVFHACGGGDIAQQFKSATSVPYQVFNNIHSQSVTSYISYPYNNEPTATYLDYNDYYGMASPKWKAANATATTLSGWRTLIRGYAALSTAETNSSTNNPLFLNAATGTFSHPDDFKRSSYPADGRGGTWPTVRGAYITGNEVIGCRL